jgi:decaprenylphospho-beta-D-erythro-pentofuranosid-2-ulose 2-reductase
VSNGASRTRVHADHPPSRVLVLGATSSIAMAVMRKLARPSTHFFLVARSKSKLLSVAQDLLVRGAGQVDMVVMDLDEPTAHAQMLTSAVERLGAIDMALLAHGVLGDQAQAEQSFVVAESILLTNFLSPASLITWLANYFEARGTGVLAVISSVAGDRGRRSNYVYGASKAALSTFLDGVRNRCDRHGVQVLTIKPGFVATPMTAHLPKNALFATPEQVATGILNAVRRRKDVVYIPWFWRPIMSIIKAIPERIFKTKNL